MSKPPLTQEQKEKVWQQLKLKYTEEEIISAQHPCNLSKKTNGYPPNVAQKWTPLEYYIRDTKQKGEKVDLKKWVKTHPNDKKKYLHLSTIDSERFVLECRQGNVDPRLIRSYIHEKVKSNREKNQKILQNAKRMRTTLLNKYGPENLCVCINGTVPCDGKSCIMVPEFNHRGKWTGPL